MGSYIRDDGTIVLGGQGNPVPEIAAAPRQTFAVGETIRQRHLDTVDAMSDEIAALRARVEAVEQLLEGRDAFIVRWGLWDDFVDSARQAIKDTPNAE